MLVVIASYGEKNLKFLAQLIHAYQNMAMETDIVVVSNAPKNLGTGVKVRVGLPSKNPWSLPFAHKAVLAENVEKYDVFIYTEDDMEVTEANIQAFLRATPRLKPDEIAGYLRYEIGQDKTALLTDVHGAFRWKPDSVRRRGDHTVAEFTNEHAGFYILTREQLKRAIASGGFLRAPYQGRYGLPETAATDPYTSCGFRKVICINVLDDFLIRHMSNLYINRHGVSLPAFKAQVQTLLSIGDGKHPASILSEVEPKVLQQKWSKSLYERPDDDLLALVPGDVKTVLSIGCGWGRAETILSERGAEVTALPLDSVIGEAVRGNGVEALYGSLNECLVKLRGRKFDCVLVTNLLHLRPDPENVVEECATLVNGRGSLLLAGPNFGHFPTRARRILNTGDYSKLGNYEHGGLTICGPRELRKSIQNAGLRLATVKWLEHSLPRLDPTGRTIRLGPLTATRWIVQARRD